MPPMKDNHINTDTIEAFISLYTAVKLAVLAGLAGVFVAPLLFILMHRFLTQSS